MNYNDQLLVDYRSTRKLLQSPRIHVRTNAEAHLDELYADVLPLEPTVRLTDSCRIFHMCDRETVLH